MENLSSREKHEYYLFWRRIFFSLSSLSYDEWRRDYNSSPFLFLLEKGKGISGRSYILVLSKLSLSGDKLPLDKFEDILISTFFKAA